MHTGFKIVSVVGAVLFGLFTSVQFNDVTQYDTAQWLTICWVIGYAIMTVLCIAALLKKPLPSKGFLYLALFVYALAIFRFTHIDWNEPLFCILSPEGDTKGNPAGNETGGLLILAIYLTLMWVFAKKNEAHMKKK